MKDIFRLGCFPRRPLSATPKSGRQDIKLFSFNDAEVFGERTFKLQSFKLFFVLVVRNVVRTATKPFFTSLSRLIGLEA